VGGAFIAALLSSGLVRVSDKILIFSSIKSAPWHFQQKSEMAQEQTPNLEQTVLKSRV